MATEQADDDEQQQQHGGFDDETMRMLSANLPDRIFRAPDPRIQMAAMEAQRTQQMTPVLKEELRLRILAKRMERGEPDIETTHTPQTYELTEEEKQKRERRKEQNRRAAKKCREKRKMRNLDVAEKYDLLLEKNEKLNSEINYRRKQREHLMDYIKEHIMSGQCKLPSSQIKLTGNSKCSTKTTLKDSSSSILQSHSSNNIVLNPTTLSQHLLPSTYPPTPKVPKLSLTIPDNYSQSAVNTNTLATTNNNSHNNNKNKIYQILVSSPQLSQMKPGDDNCTTTQNPLRSMQHHLAPFQITTTTSTTTSNIAVPPDANQEAISGTHTIFLNQQHLHHHHHHHHHQQQQQQQYNPSYNITTGTSTNLPTSTSPKPGQPPRPAMSRTPSTTSPFAPPQSPCTSHQSSSITLTPPPSVSSEQYFVPESPSILHTFTTTTTTTSGVPNDLVIQCGTQSVDQNILTPPIIYPQFSSGNGLNYQLSPADSISGKSPPFDILTDKMFDDEDDDEEEDDEGRSNLILILDTLDSVDGLRQQPELE